MLVIDKVCHVSDGKWLGGMVYIMREAMMKVNGLLWLRLATCCDSGPNFE